MPRYCTVCAHKKSSDITKSLTAGVSLSAISERFKVTKAAAHRHLVNCLRITRRAERVGGDAAAREGVRVSSRFENGRCQECGTQLEDANPQSLVKRAERLLWLAETIGAKAQKDDDARLALQAVDRARASLEQLLKVHGLLQPDGAVTIHVDQRKQAYAMLASFPEVSQRALQHGDCPHCGESLIAPVETIGAEIGASLRDQKALTAS